MIEAIYIQLRQGGQEKVDEAQSGGKSKGKEKWTNQLTKCRVVITMFRHIRPKYHRRRT
jgi:hypothetical protein